jgi:DUF1680 family protein
VLGAVMASPNGTVIVASYAPTVSTLPDGNVITVDGHYPFADNVSISVTKPTKLSLRIPCWSSRAVVQLGGAAGGGGSASVSARPCGYHHVAATPATPVSVTFDNPIHIYEWVANKTDGDFQPGGTLGGGVEVSPKRLLDESPWWQFTSECQRF